MGKIEISKKIEKLNFNIMYCGKVNNKEWPYFLWDASINGENFTYRTGLRHFTPHHKADRKSFHGGKNKKPLDGLSNSDLGGWLHVPSKLDILNCLFMDSSAIDESFENWADNFGYSSDSIDALEIYRACIKGAKKLKSALGENFNSIREEIEALEL